MKECGRNWRISPFFECFCSGLHAALGVIMEDLSETGWRKSDNSRGLNTSRVSNWNPRLVFHDSGFRKEPDRVVLACHNLKNQVGSSGGYKDEVAVDPFARAIEWGDVSLRQWLDKTERFVDEFECLHIFRQIVEIVTDEFHKGLLFITN